MGLADATEINGGPRPSLPDGPPYACDDLLAWAGVGFEMPPGDPRLTGLLHGDEAPSAPLQNLEGAGRWWLETPELMDILDPESPTHDDKVLERALYLDRWARHVAPGSRVMDLGGGVGRFTQWLLELGCAVDLVDPDLRSLWRAVSMAAGGPGRLDVHWTTGERLPKLPPLDAVVAAEVLCYVEDAPLVVQNVHQALKPGGMLLCSVEARWGWAMSTDAPEGALDAFLTDGIVSIPGDRWVRTYERQDLVDLLDPWFEIVDLLPTHYAFSGPFELVTGMTDLPTALAIEERLRQHPVSAPLNRAWTAVARRRDR